MNWATGYPGYLHELMILRLFKHFSSRVFTIYGIEWDLNRISMGYQKQPCDVSLKICMGFN
jgi:hypothetical protein